MTRAVLTRDLADAQSYGAALAPLGLDIVAMPVTRIAPAADPDALRRAILAGGHTVVVVASPRAAHELARARDVTLATLPEVWAVGAATQRALVIARIPATHPAGVRDAAGLARKIIATMPVDGRRILVPRAEEGRDDAIRILRAANAIVDDIIAYRTIAAPADDPQLSPGLELLLAGRASLCAVFAPSQVAALDALLARRGSSVAAITTKFVAIGDTTATALRATGVAQVAVAETPTPEGIANAARAVYPSQP